MLPFPMVSFKQPLTSRRKGQKRPSAASRKSSSSAPAIVHALPAVPLLCSAGSPPPAVSMEEPCTCSCPPVSAPVQGCSLSSGTSAPQVPDAMPQPPPGSSSADASRPEVPSSPCALDGSSTAPTCPSGPASPPAPPCPPAPETSKPWVNLFRDNRSPSAGIPLSQIAPDFCSLSASDLSPTSSVWGHTLIGYVAGRFPGKKALQQCCQSWSVPCDFSTHESGWLLFRFKSDCDMQQVLDSGPYFIFQRPLLLKVVPAFFRFDNAELTHVPVWVRLRNLPLELWNATCLSKILSRIGTPIKTDGLTLSRQRFSYARALVDINVAASLITEIPLVLPNGSSFCQEVEYEFVPHYCSTCKAIGHSAARCKTSQGKAPPTPVVTQPPVRARAAPAPASQPPGPSQPAARGPGHKGKAPQPPAPSPLPPLAGSSSVPGAAPLLPVASGAPSALVCPADPPGLPLAPVVSAMPLPSSSTAAPPASPSPTTQPPATVTAGPSSDAAVVFTAPPFQAVVSKKSKKRSARLGGSPPLPSS